MFWANGNFHPKTKNRFLVSIDGKVLWSIKTCTKPSVTVDVKEFRMMNHYYKYPGLVKWGPIKMTFVDPYGEHNKDYGGGAVPFVGRDTHGWTSRFFRGLLSRGGYQTPENAGLTTIEKASMLDNSFEKNSLVIQQISFGFKSEDGESNTPHVVESWKIVNPLVKSIDWGSLDYNDISPVEYTLELEYDYAISSHGQAQDQKAFTNTARAAPSPGDPTAADMLGFSPDLAAGREAAVRGTLNPSSAPPVPVPPGVPVFGGLDDSEI